VVGSGVGCYPACRCQVGLSTGCVSHGRGISREKRIPGCVGCSRVELGHELYGLCESWSTTGRVKGGM